MEFNIGRGESLLGCGGSSLLTILFTLYSLRRTVCRVTTLCTMYLSYT